MDFAGFENPRASAGDVDGYDAWGRGDIDDDPDAPLAVKLVIAGGLGVGKTTLVRSVTEIKSLHTEELMSEEGDGIDDLSGVPRKVSTTVALDFGRISIDEDIILYLFGTPGQSRFWFMWEELAYGATGVVILADTRRLEDCFPAVDFFEIRQIPFLVAVNCFDDAPRFHPEVIRAALDLGPEVPVMLCDARERISSRDVLVEMVEHARELMDAQA
jgi:signal recognition particle receptor subunit beta